MVNIPFKLDRFAAKGLVDQAVDGLRSAIEDGIYPPGRSLPSQSAFAAAAGVSLKVPRQAYRRLAHDGKIALCRGLGYVVPSPRAQHWKGRVLIVCVNRGSYIGLANIGLDRILTAAGYFVSYAHVIDGTNGYPACASLDSALRACRYDVIFSFDARDDLIARFEKIKTPYIVNIPHRRYKNCALGLFHRGSVCRDESAIGRLVQTAKRLKVHSAVWVDFQDVYLSFVTKLRRAGIQTTFLRVGSVRNRSVTPAEVRRCAYELFDEMCRTKSAAKPGFYFFTDDCVADGALMAFALHGVDVPGDVRIVTLTNREAGLAYPRDFTRLEVDAERDGEDIARYVLDCIGSRKLNAALGVGPRFVAGETF